MKGIFYKIKDPYAFRYIADQNLPGQFEKYLDPLVNIWITIQTTRLLATLCYRQLPPRDGCGAGMVETSG
jgi:hypothetical protein